MIDRPAELFDTKQAMLGVVAPREPVARDAPKRTGPTMRQVVESILLVAVSRGASEIAIEPLAGEVRVRYSIAGRRGTVCESLPAGVATGLSAIVKEYAHLDVDDCTHTQEGRIRLKVETCAGIVHDVRLRVDVSPTEFGEMTTMRLRDSGTLDTIQSGESSSMDFDRSLEIVKALAADYSANSPRRRLVPRPPMSVRGQWTG